MRRFSSFLACVFIVLAAGAINAQTLPPAEEDGRKNVVEKQEAKSRLTISGWIESSFTGNVAAPNDNQNFGRLFDDRSNEFVMNQAVITAERALDPKVGFDWGFKFQFLFGTDARYIHALGLLDHAMSSSLYQPDIPEIYLTLHLPLVTDGGIDVKLGKFVTLEAKRKRSIRVLTHFFRTPTFSTSAARRITPVRCLRSTQRSG